MRAAVILPAIMAIGAAGAHGMEVKLPTDAWLGRWIGPAGTILEIGRDGPPFSGRYRLMLVTGGVPGAVTTGLAKLDTIVFRRDGREAVLKERADGCLTIDADVYCRVTDAPR